MTYERLRRAPPVRGRGLVLSVPNQVLAVLCLMYLVLYIDRVNIATLAPTMTEDLGLTNTQFGLAVSAFAYPYALFQLCGGWISDKFGARRTLAICGVLVCAATALTGAAAGLVSLIAVRLLLGFGEGGAFPSATRAMVSSTSRGRWGFAQGITHGASRLGNALTPPLIVTILAFSSWRGAFVILGLFSSVWVVLWVWVTRRNTSPRVSPSMAYVNETTPAIPWWQLVKRIAPVTAVDFCYGWTLWVFLTWLPTFFLKNFHLNLASSAFFSGGVLMGGVAGDLVGGFVSDYIYRRTDNLQAARRNVIIAGMVGAFAFLIPVVLIHDLRVITICLSLACFASELVVAPIWAVPMDIAPRYAGAASGLMNFGFGLAGIVSPVVFGSLLDLTGGWTAPFCGSIALLLVGAFLALFMRPDRPFEPGA